MKEETKRLIVETFRRTVVQDPSVVAKCPEDFFVMLDVGELDDKIGYPVQVLYAPIHRLSVESLRRKVISMRSPSMFPCVVCFRDAAVDFFTVVLGTKGGSA